MEALKRRVQRIRKQSKISLPRQVESLLKGSIFDLENHVVLQELNRYLFYMPEVIRIFGLQIAQLRKLHRELQRLKDEAEAEILLQAVEVEGHRYKNEQLRRARVLSDPSYQEILKLQNAVQYDIDVLDEEAWKYRNLQKALSNIAELKANERN